MWQCLVLSSVLGQLHVLQCDTHQVHYACGIMIVCMTWCSRVWLLLIHHVQNVASHQVVCMHLLGVYMCSM